MKKTNSNDDSDNLIVAVDDEGNEHVIDIDLCNDTVDKVMESLFNLQEQEDRFDFTTASYGLFISAYHVLLSSGWSMAELVKDMEEYLEDHKKSMN